jgi:hypothetical protein
LYIAHTEKVLLLFQTKVSLHKLSCTSRRLSTSFNHLSQLSPTNARLNEMLSSIVLNMWATITVFFLTMLYKDENFSIRGLHLSKDLPKI